MYTTVFNIYNNNELVEHQIRMISDFSNDAENSTLMSKLHFTINSYRKKAVLYKNCINILQYYFYLYFQSNKWSLGEQKRLLLKTLNILHIKNF